MLIYGRGWFSSNCNFLVVYSTNLGIFSYTHPRVAKAESLNKLGYADLIIWKDESIFTHPNHSLENAVGSKSCISVTASRCVTFDIRTQSNTFICPIALKMLKDVLS